jgi:hypothetical protein
MQETINWEERYNTLFDINEAMYLDWTLDKFEAKNG